MECETIPFRDKEESSMKKRTLAAAGLAMIMAVSLAGCSTTVSVPDTVKVEMWETARTERSPWTAARR